MALTEFQRTVARTIADNRRKSGESYVAGGAALNTLLSAPRLSKDIDLFHDSAEAVQQAWKSDKDTLAEAGYDVMLKVDTPSFISAIVGKGNQYSTLQWAFDSAYRFFPLVEHEELGLTLHVPPIGK